MEVYFDDIKVKRTRSRLIQGAEYYAYGMQTAGSWTRDGEKENNFLANGGTELNRLTGLYDLDYRQYDPVLGRMNQVDPAAAKYASLSPYNFGFNNPVMWNDPMGADPHDGDNGSEDAFYIRRSRQPGGMYGFGGEGQTIDPQTYFGGSTGEANFNELARYGFGGNPFAVFDVQKNEWISNGMACGDPQALVEYERRNGTAQSITDQGILNAMLQAFKTDSRILYGSDRGHFIQIDANGRFWIPYTDQQVDPEAFLTSFNPTHGEPGSLIPVVGDILRAKYWNAHSDYSRVALYSVLAASDFTGLKAALSGAVRFGARILGRMAAKGGTQFMKYQVNFVLNSSWKNWGNYMTKQGWSFQQVEQTLMKGGWQPWTKNQNWLNPGNSMSLVTNPNTGQSLIIDNVTREIIQLGKVGHSF